MESLLAVVETGSITAAARRQNLTAAAIGQRIQTLERLFSCELLLRGAHSATPSECCLAMLPMVRALIQQTIQLQNGFNSEELGGELKIGVISTILTGILPDVIIDLASVAPRLTLRITPGDSRYLYDRLLSGELDGAILVHPPFKLPSRLHGHRLRSEPLLLLTQNSVEEADIISVINTSPLIRYHTDTWGGRIAEKYLHDNALHPEIFCDLDSLEAISVLVGKGIGLSLVPAWTGLTSEKFNVIPLPGSEGYNREIILLSQMTPHKPAALATFTELLKRADGCSGIYSDRG
ncbi:LysR family transcriptional regulator [Serratia marcescens]